MDPSFKPIRLAGNGTSQTIASVFWPQTKQVPGHATRHHVGIGADGFLSVVENRPDGWRHGDRVVLLVHGLTGSEESTHLVRLAAAFVRRGFIAVRMNMRGCGPGVGLASGIYHSGRSEDVRAVLEWIGRQYSKSPTTVIGISLGGNATLKMAGEFGASVPDFLDGVVGVSAPIDLGQSSEKISHWKNSIFNRYFTKRLVQHIGQLSREFPGKVRPLPDEWKNGPESLARLDDVYVGPMSGFKNGQDYYDRCSAGPLLASIKCQTLLLTSADDPIIDPAPYLRMAANPNCELVMTRHGGHAAWISATKTPEFGRFWMDQKVVDWVTHSRKSSR